ncbi:MAG: ROK family protein [Nitrospirae bacterium]|nr:ROK family protein [Nitrospirota bacterium]
MQHLIGVDLGGTNLKVALLDKKGEIRKKTSVLTARGKQAVLQQIIESIEKVLEKTGVKKSAVLGIGIGTPGLVDNIHGIVRGFTNIKGWRNVPLKEYVEREIKLPVYVDNDVNLMTLGELMCGAGRGAKNIVCLTLGTGVGGGIVIEGNLYRGSTLSAGEIGHVSVNADGPRCICGSYGCLERYVGNAYIVKKAVEAIEGGRRSIIKKLVEGDLKAVTPRVISRAARQGDRLAGEIWEETGRYIGIVLSGVVNLLDPEIIVIGGGVAQAGRLLFEPIRKTVKERAMSIPARKVKIVPAKLGKDAGLIGAGMLVKVEANKISSLHPA